MICSAAIEHKFRRAKEMCLMNNNSNNKETKKNIFSGNIGKIVALCLFSLAVVSITLASYTTQDRGGDQSRVASFNVEAVDVTGWDYQLTELFCRYDISKEIDDGYYQYLAYKVQVQSNSEVDVEYTVEGINFPNNIPDFVDVLLIENANLDGATYPNHIGTATPSKGPAYKEAKPTGTTPPNGDEYEDNLFYQSGSSTVYKAIKEDVTGGNNIISQRVTFDKVGTDAEGDTLKGILDTAGSNPKTAEFYIVFKVDFVEFNEQIENSTIPPTPKDDDFEYKETDELVEDSYIQYFKEFDFEIDINFVQVD